MSRIVSNQAPVRRFALDPIWVLAVAALALAVFVVGYPGNDDKYITYAAADAMAAGNGFANVNGVPTEQSSTLLLTALLAAVVAVTGASAPVVGYWVTLSIFAMTFLLAAAMLHGSGKPGWLAAAVLVAPPVLYWGLSGMENGLYLLLLVGWVVVFSGLYTSTSWQVYCIGILLTTLLCLTRPEAPFALGAALIAWGILGRDLSLTVRHFGIAVVGIGTAFAFRLAIGLSLFPLPVTAKTGGDRLDDLGNGLDYLIKTLFNIPATSSLCLIVLCVLLIRLRRSPTDMNGNIVAGSVSVAMAVIAFSVAAGGDWMPFARFLVPAFALILLAGVIALPVSPVLMLTVGLLAAASDLRQIASWVTMPSIAFHQTVPDDTLDWLPALDRTSVIHTRDALLVDEVLAIIEADPRESLTIGSIQMGFVPYWLSRRSTKDLHFIDFRGLTTTDLHDCDTISSPYHFRIYKNLSVGEACAGRKLSYIVDLLPPGRIEVIEGQGCSLVERFDRTVTLPTWSVALRQDTFIARCQ